MLSITIITLGKLKEVYWPLAETEYLKRLQPFARVTIQELKEISFTEKDPVDFVKHKESEKIQEALDKLESGFVIALEEKGKQFSSPDFARQLQKWSEMNNNLIFIIGGPLGLHDSVRQLAKATLSLSSLTFTHQMTRVILLEQLYRAQMINQGRRYHY